MAITSPAQLTDYLVRYPQEVAFGDEEPAVVLDRYHSADFELWNDGLRRFFRVIRPRKTRRAVIFGL